MARWPTVERVSYGLGQAFRTAVHTQKDATDWYRVRRYHFL